MSYQAVDWVQKHSRSKGTARMVLILIAHHDGSRGMFPSIDTLARGAHTSRATVFRCLKILKELGELDWIPGAGREHTNLYTLPLFARQAALFGVENNLRPFLRENSLNSATKRSHGCDPSIKREEEKDKPPRTPRAGDPRSALFLEFAREGFRAVHAQAPAWTGKDDRQFAALLSRNPELSFDEWKRRWKHFLSSSDSFICGQGHSLAFFCNNFDRFIDGPLLAAPAGGKQHGDSGGYRKSNGGIAPPAGKYNSRVPDAEFTE
jgi:hypothetical protein